MIERTTKNFITAEISVSVQHNISIFGYETDRLFGDSPVCCHEWAYYVMIGARDIRASVTNTGTDVMHLDVATDTDLEQHIDSIMGHNDIRS
jgi:hypothetical protein